MTLGFIRTETAPGSRRHVYALPDVPWYTVTLGAAALRAHGHADPRSGAEPARRIRGASAGWSRWRISTTSSANGCRSCSPSGGSGLSRSVRPTGRSRRRDQRRRPGGRASARCQSMISRAPASNGVVATQPGTSDLILALSKITECALSPSRPGPQSGSSRAIASLVDVHDLRLDPECAPEQPGDLVPGERLVAGDVHGLPDRVRVAEAGRRSAGAKSRAWVSVHRLVPSPWMTTGAPRRIRSSCGPAALERDGCRVVGVRRPHDRDREAVRAVGGDEHVLARDLVARVLPERVAQRRRLADRQARDRLLRTRTPTRCRGTGRCVRRTARRRPRPARDGTRGSSRRRRSRASPIAAAIEAGSSASPTRWVACRDRRARSVAPRLSRVRSIPRSSARRADVGADGAGAADDEDAKSCHALTLPGARDPCRCSV